MSEPAAALIDVLQLLERDRERHMMGAPSDEEELRRLESALGMAVPGSLRFFLGRLGGGIFYERDEIFGARRLMIHDIELVPDLLSMYTRLRPEIGEQALPFHRASGLVHVLDTSVGDDPPVYTLDRAGRYPDLATFVRKTMLPPAMPEQGDA